MNWFSSGRVDTFRFVRVRWGTWTETEELEGIIGGTLERNDSTAIKASGSLDYILEPALGSDLVQMCIRDRSIGATSSPAPITGD